ncbi:MAG: hypothetical protein ACI392_03055 [Paludibacteraceae bacterium]
MKLHNTRIISWLNATLRYAFVLVFLLYYGCCVLSTHVHIDGARFVTHAHPYSSPNHQHTTADFDHLRLVNVVAVATPLGVSFLCLLQVIEVLCVRVSDVCRSVWHYALALLRAPPAV